jgi:hypothetical protein
MMQTSTKGGDISSASPTVIDTDGDYFDVTGTTNFAAFTVTAGRRFTIQFDGALTMTHHASTLDLPGAANITTAAGDVAEFFATGTNTVQCVNYTKADGTAVVLADNAITLAKMAGGTDGQIITFDASGDPVAVGPGSDGQVLTSTGAGSPPAFEAAGGGSVEFLGEIDVSNVSSVDITSANGLTANQTVIGCYFEGFSTNTNNNKIWMRYSSDNGSSFYTTSYICFGHGREGASELGYNTPITNAIQISGQDHGTTDNVYGLWGWVWWPANNGTSNGPYTTWNVGGREGTSNDFWWSTGGGTRNSATDFDAFQFLSSSGNVSGRIQLYAWKDS